MCCCWHCLTHVTCAVAVARSRGACRRPMVRRVDEPSTVRRRCAAWVERMFSRAQGPFGGRGLHDLCQRARCALTPGSAINCGWILRGRNGAQHHRRPCQLYSRVRDQMSTEQKPRQSDGSDRVTSPRRSAMSFQRVLSDGEASPAQPVPPFPSSLPLILLSSFWHAFAHSFIHPFIHSFTPSFMHTFIHSSIRTLIVQLLHSSIHSLIHLLDFRVALVHSFIRSFSRLRLLMFVYLFPSGARSERWCLVGSRWTRRCVAFHSPSGGQESPQIQAQFQERANARRG